MRRLFVCGFVALVTACQANASVSAKANTSGEASGSASGDMKSNDTTTSTPPPQNQTTTTAAPVTASGPAADACPFQCFIADGANMTPVSTEDLDRLHTAFASTVNDMMRCTGDGGRRHRTSPVLNVRVNFKGEVTDVGVDPRGYENVDTCVEAVARPLPGGTFPGPATIRCSEKCERPQTVNGRARGKRGGAQQAPQPAAPQQPAPSMNP